MSEYNLGHKMTDDELKAQAPSIYTLAKKLDPFLAKYGLDNHTAEVGFMLDYSGSMEFKENLFYSSGKMQKLVERMLPFAVRFDDNATIDAWLFSSGVSKRFDITPANFEGCVDRMRANERMGGTDFITALDAVREHYGVKTPRQHPVYLAFLTDGAPHDARATTRKVAEMAETGIFIQFVALGEDWPKDPNQPAEKKSIFSSLFGGSEDSSRPSSDGMRYLATLDDDLATPIDSISAFAIKDPISVSEERLYELMTSEYPEWLGKAKQHGLLAA